MFIEFGELILQFPGETREINLELTITAYKLALQVLSPERFSDIIQMVQAYLALAYSQRIRGDQSDNLEQSISLYKLALQNYPRKRNPGNWAEAQFN